jgi:hypothetical protein
MLVSASVTAPQAPLIDMPRNSSGYQRAAAVGTIVKCRCIKRGKDDLKTNIQVIE